MPKKRVVTRKDLAAELAAKSALSHAHAADLVNRLVNLLIDHLYQGHPIELRGFARLEVIPTVARPGRNPKTGEPHLIPAGRHVRFRLSRKLVKLLGAAP